MSGGLARVGEKLGADVIAISVDSPFAQEAWAQKNFIKLTLVSDLNKETTKAYGVLFPVWPASATPRRAPLSSARMAW